MSGICKALIKPPETSDETLGILGYRFGKISALRGYGPDDSNGTVGAVQVVHHTCPLVKRGQS